MTVTERLDKHDKQIASIRALVQEGMRLVVETRKDIRKLAAMQLTTEAAQKRTEESLRAFIDSMRGGGNGHTKQRVD
jgi:hypothetical protein